MRTMGMPSGRLRRVGAALVGVAALGLSSCTGLDIVGDNQSPFVMTVSNITGAPGSTGQDDGDILYSDVSQIINDDAIVSVTILRKNPRTSATGPLESILLERYEVNYIRSDGRGIEGVDVPFRFTGPLNKRLDGPVGTGVTTQDVVVSVVRHQAKEEPPLKNMVGFFGQGQGLPFIGSGADTLTTFAEITIHGKTLSGEGLVASARLQVTFADFVDEQ